MRIGKDWVQVESVNEIIGNSKVWVGSHDIIVAHANEVFMVPCD